jgi:hypothetical protein
MGKTSKLSEEEIFKQNRAFYSRRVVGGKGGKKIHNPGIHASDCLCRSCRRMRKKVMLNHTKKRTTR